ncbi:hypothetical protein FRC09_010627, partial [Ceratobasidium sp. 395]
MSESRNPSPSSAIVHRWKETGRALANTLSEYVELCLDLSRTSEETSDSSTDLVSQLDSVLRPGALFTVLSDKLTRSQVAVTKARNILASPVYKLPSETLSKIFLCFVYKERSASPVYVEFTVRSLYHRLHTLLGVCSGWRDVGISTPALWKLIPVIRSSRFSLSYSAASLSLNRSGALPLDIAAMIPQVFPESPVADFIKHASRIRTINIISQEPYTIQDIMYPLMEHNISSSLFGLSLCVTNLEHVYRLGDEPYYFFLPNHESSEDHLPRLLQSLTQLRFSGATFDWTRVTFSHRLVEIRVHSVVLGKDPSLHEFLRAVSTAPELQRLSLASVSSFKEPNPGTPPEVRLPKLQSLILDHLYSNTLSIILRSIMPISHRLTLSITDRTVQTVWPEHPNEPIAASLTGLRLLLEGISVDTLLLGEMFSGPRLFLAPVLNTIQSLNTLQVNEWIVDAEFCKLFTWRESRFNTLELGIPKIRNLHLTNARLVDQQGLKDLVLSHGLEMMLLGGYLTNDFQLEDWRSLMLGD